MLEIFSSSGKIFRTHTTIAAYSNLNTHPLSVFNYSSVISAFAMGPSFEIPLQVISVENNDQQMHKLDIIKTPPSGTISAVIAGTAGIRCALVKSNTSQAPEAITSCPSTRGNCTHVLHSKMFRLPPTIPESLQSTTCISRISANYCWRDRVLNTNQHTMAARFAYIIGKRKGEKGKDKGKDECKAKFTSEDRNCAGRRKQKKEEKQSIRNHPELLKTVSEGEVQPWQPAIDDKRQKGPVVGYKRPENQQKLEWYKQNESGY
ncbi:hypothetical protein BJ165DRAFT_1397472 [Panaeolus papilionaceus]|nr:hypothetical protein BJ165DRAFT_1397472 [Panaeolus papilionaceus]